jgi:hypothetical protein
VIPVHDKDGHEAYPEDDVAPARADGGDGAVTLIFSDVAGAAAKEEAHSGKEEEQNEEEGMEVVASGAE